MVSAAPMAMNTDPGLILAQWFSPAYPVGGFAYSHGLETAIAEGVVRDRAALQAWLEGVLAQGSGRTDAILLAAAHRGEIAEADALARALAPSAERLRETVLQGEAFARTTAAIWGIALPPLAYPVAVGAAARALALPVEATARHYLQGFAGNLVSAAVRLVPLGQTEGQTCLAALAPLCARLAAETSDGDLDETGGAAFLSDIAAMRHETLHVRLFRS